MPKAIRFATLALLVTLVAAPADSTAATIDLDWQLNTHLGTTTIDLGDTVRWTLRDAFPHTVTSTGNFDSGVISGNGNQFSFTFNSVGMFDYFCAVHGIQSMSGTIKVEQPVANDSSSWGKVKALFR